MGAGGAHPGTDVKLKRTETTRSSVMKRMFSGVFAALLVAGLVGALSAPASAGGRGYRDDCNCDGPVTKVVPAGTQVVTSHRTVTTNRVIPRVQVRDKNRVIVHRRTILHRQIVTHRHNTEHRNVTVNRINTAHKFETVRRNQVVHRRVNTRSQSNVVRNVKGRDCNCAPGQPGFRGMAYFRKHSLSSRY